MNRISISQAWSYATSFFNGQAANHAIVLIGVGIVLPLIIQMVVGGGSAAMFDPAAMASGGMMAMGGMALVGLFVVALINYILQTGSYFASWRIGFTNGAEPLGGALGYGIVAALPVLLLTFVLVIVFGLIAFLIFGGAMAPMLMGGGQPDAMAAASTGLLVLLLMPLFLLFAVWLAARFCCMGPIMADRRSFNVITALGDSWRMTAMSQWKIFGYFLLIGVALFVIFLIFTLIVGVSMFAGGGQPGAGSMIGVMVGALLISVPMAYLQVGVPAGIYRALGQGGSGDVFA